MIEPADLLERLGRLRAQVTTASPAEAALPVDKPAAPTAKPQAERRYFRPSPPPPPTVGEVFDDLRQDYRRLRTDRRRRGI